MSDQAVIDVEQLLAPISETQPAGEELPLSEPQGPLMRTKDAWDEARKQIRKQQDWEQSGGVDAFNQKLERVSDPDWNGIIHLATEALMISKDFRVAAWLTEALMRKHHLAGLNDGLSLCLGLCERYWADIHPGPNEEDGHAVTMGAFAGVVSDATASAIMETPVVCGQKPSEREFKQYSAVDYSRAKELATISDSAEVERRLELGYIDMLEFDSIKAVTPPEFHQRNLELIDSCLDKLTRLGEFFQENCRDDEYGESTAPGVFFFREQLESLRRLIVELSGGPVEEQLTEVGEVPEVPGGGVSTSQVMTRETAFQTIERVAQFFEKSEPHSPVHYALRQVVRWGKMPLPDLLAELVEDGSVMESLRKRVGFPAREQSDF